MKDKKFIIHYTSPYSDHEMTMPIMEESLEHATRWAVENLEEENCLTVTRVRPVI